MDRPAAAHRTATRRGVRAGGGDVSGAPHSIVGNSAALRVNSGAYRPLGTVMNTGSFRPSRA